MVPHCIQDTLSSRAALGLPAECVARAKVSCIQGSALMPIILAVDSRLLQHSLHHCHGHSGQIQPENDYWLREQNEPSGVLRHDSCIMTSRAIQKQSPSVI